MAKILLISGSPRKGNSDHIISRIFDKLAGEKDIIRLREEKISQCLGCSVCFDTQECVQKDLMREIIVKFQENDIVVLGTPNYYDNVPGLVKNFFDRLSPLYDTDLKGKKLVVIISAYHEPGSESLMNCEQAIRNFARLQNMDVKGVFHFQGQEVDDVQKDPKTEGKIDEIVTKIVAL